MVEGRDSMSEETSIDVRFGCGEELLSSYWGYLTGGGLIIADPGLEVGDALSMRVSIDSSESQYRLRGTVVKREPDTAKAIIAFRAGEAHDMLLSEALADSENVAPRRHARFRIGSEVMVSGAGSEVKAVLVNLSREGCCLELPRKDREALAMDTEVALHHESVHALGTVVWSRNLERGLKLSADEAAPLLAALLPDVC